MSSIYDKASLVLIPSGTKTSKVYSQKPTNGDGDFTFSRSTAATRVNADGNIEKETQNLLLQSNSFNIANWLKTLGLTSGQAGYDGSNDAWLATKDAANEFVYQSVSLSGVQTFSIYAKANASDWIRLRNTGGYVYFDVANGAVGGNINAIDASITSVGNGWYRCEVVWSGTGTIVQLWVADSDGSTSGTSGSVYIQDAQLEQGLVARDYIETTTTAVEGGITDNVPRLDYTDSSCPALLLEPQRTNSIQHSEYFAGWNTITNVSINHNESNSPEGIQNATEIVPNTSNGNHFIDKSGFNRTAGEYITTTIYAKANGYDYLYFSLSASRLYGVFDISNGAVMLTNSNGTDFNNDSGSIEDVGNGWYRCTLIGQAVNSGGTYFRVSCAPTSSNTHTPTFAGDGTSGVLVYGAQVELNSSYATSYIPTYGSAVTRNLDSAETATPSTSLFNQTEGVIYAEWENVSNGNSRLFNLKGGGHQIYIKQFGTSSERIFGVVYNGSGNVFSASTPNNYLTIGDTYKVALRYKDGEYAFYVNGTQIATSTATGLGSMAADKIDLENNDNAGSCKHKQVLYFPATLTNAELADLTTL